MNMPDKNTCILSYSNSQEVLQAIRKLQANNFNLSTVSIIGNGNDKNECVVGIYRKAGQTRFYGAQAMFWESLWQTFDGELFLMVPESESLTAAGLIVSLLVKEQDDVDIHGFSVLGAALFKMGVPGESIHQYESAIKAEKILLIVNARRTEVERSCEILHSESQRATVHLA